LTFPAARGWTISGHGADARRRCAISRSRGFGFQRRIVLTMPRRILLEGRPGSGKTTVTATLVELLTQQGVEVAGFVTRELRDAGRRVGFSVQTVAGQEATLAHVRRPGPPRVGRYGVDLATFERIALPALAKPPARGVVVIDELGKMELASSRFRDAVSRLLDDAIDIVATVHDFRDPFTDELKQREDVERLRVTPATRVGLPQELVRRLRPCSTT
jgi:nucleoside-triphosphatase